MAGSGHYSLDDGRTLVKAARSTVELYVKSPKFEKGVIEKDIDKYRDHLGIFVTIEHYPTMSLRGCIGFPIAVGPVSRMLIDAAIAAAAEDPRFVPLSHRELDHIVLSVSVLSKPEQIKGESEGAKLREIKIGRDGLIIKYGFKSGVFLPIVALEQKWSKDEYLRELCLKAGIPEDSWKRPDVGLYKFTAQVFKETEPGGSVEEVA